MTEFFNRIISDVKLLIRVHDYTEAFQRFGVDPKIVVQNIEARICTTQHDTAEIPPQPFGKTLTSVKWKRLIIPNYFRDQD